MKTNRKIMISLGCLVIALVLFIIIWSAIDKDEDEEILENENVNEEVEDFSIYNEIEKNDVEEADDVDSPLSEEDTRYLIKSVDNYISIYYLTDENEEILYKETTISVEYLSQADIDDLEVGIEVTGKEELNKTLEDFE